MYVQTAAGTLRQNALRDANLRDRGFGFDFAFAALIFDGLTVEIEDRRHDYGEKRMVAIGQADGIHITAVYTDRNLVRRIISARRSSRRKRQIYAEATAV